MRILLVTDSYPPEIRSASHLMLELSQELRRRKHDVTVITTFPEYNIDKDCLNKKINEKEIEGGVNVIRVKTLPHHNVSYLLRGISQLIMPFQFIKKLYRYGIYYDAVVVYSPPLPLAIVGFLARKLGAHFVLNVQDLFPQNAIDLGILKSKIHIKFFQMVEKFAYKSANVITAHSIGNLEFIKKFNPLISHKLFVLHNWIDINQDEGSPIVQINFRDRWKIKEEYIAVFAGVMGPSQYLELVLQVAKKMQDYEDLLFLFVGGGVERSHLEKLTLEMKLKNVKFENFISRDAYSNLLSICSIGLVCLSPRNKTPVVPGKILGYMAAGLPIAAFLHPESDAHDIIKVANCGISADSSQLQDCVIAFESLFKNIDDAKKIGRAGKLYVKNNFSKRVIVNQLEELLIRK
jgi:colanic acid biosynthesis glycosyl transferase WcaI